MNARSLIEGSASRGMPDSSNGVANTKKICNCTNFCYQEVVDLIRWLSSAPVKFNGAGASFGINSRTA